MKNHGRDLRRTDTNSAGKFPFHLRILCALFAASLLGAAPALAVDDPDEIYLGIFKSIQRADTLSESGRLEAALAKYQQAQTNLAAFKNNFPTWNVKLVSYRLNYLADKIEDLSKPPPEPPTASAPPEKSEKSEAPAPAPAAKPAASQVKLIEAGSEPRQKLRLHPQADDMQSVVVTIKTAMDMGTGQPIKLPVIKTPMEVVTKSVSPDGVIAYETTFGDPSLAEDAEAAPQVAEALKSQIAGLKGLVITGTLSARGLASGVKIKAPPGTNPQTRMMLEQIKDAMSTFSCPLPEEPVGAGAKWEVKQSIKTQGLTIAQTATYELVAIQADRLETKSSIAQSLSSPGSKAELGKMSGSGAGTSTWELSRIYPARASIDGHSEIVVGMGANKQGMTMKTETSVQIESK